MKTESIKEKVNEQVMEILEMLKEKKPLSIKIIDPVCALDFQKYAKNFEWTSDNEFTAQEIEQGYKLIGAGYYACSPMAAKIKTTKGREKKNGKHHRM